MRPNCNRTIANVFGIGLALAPLIASAHTRERPTPENVWSAWHIDPLIAIPMLLASWIYLRGVRDLWATVGRGKVIVVWQRNCWLGAMASLIVALFSPVDALGGALFSAHMVQHLILFVVTLCLLACARPGVVMWWGLPRGWRAHLGRGPAKSLWLRRLHRLTQNPTVIVMVFTAVLWLWHTPALYDAALRSNVIHAIEHLSFMLGAWLLWSWLMSIHLGYGHRAGGRQGLAILIVFATVIQSGLLGAILTFAQRPFYSMHEGYTRLWGLSLLEDQQIAGILMWIPMGMSFTLVALLLFRSWLVASDHRARQREGAESSLMRRSITEVHP